jgi:hypothetical protein
MNKLSIAPVEWSSLKDIDQIEPINDEDTDCLLEVREVLKKYGRLDRFGVALLHSHFDLADDEIMLESTDEANRTLTTKPVRRSEAGTNNIGTVWMLREGDIATMAWCRKYCYRWGLQHLKSHDKTPSVG